MMYLKRITLGMVLCAAGCSTPHPPKTASLPPAAPAAFDTASNGLADQATHKADQAKFEQVETITDGLGPLFNGQSCSECHQSPVTGGVSQVTELRVGHKGKDGSFQNPEIPINHGSEIIKGRSLINSRAICPNAAYPNVDITERVPDTETIRTFRTSLNILGDGFVEAVDDATLIGLSQSQCKSGGKICGLVLRVPVLESPGTTRVGRFGWKNQHASLLSFAGDAYLNEIGITNTLFPDEVTKLCNTVAEPNDKPGPDGLSDIDRFARFMRATKAPARDLQQAATPAATHGAALFEKIGCATCHVPTMITAPPGTTVNGGKFIIPQALGNKTIHPYGDFLLHDVGTGDGIVVAIEEHYSKRMKNMSLDQATANRMRTAPLWGVRMEPMLMHDGASVTFRDAILRHRGEASEVTKHYEKLGQKDQDAITEFLKSL
jgi:CxxC motif-containing protein (DUF1111 family)